MMKKDYLIRGTALSNSVRFVCVDATETINYAQKIHNAYPTAIAGLGRVMIQNIMMSSLLKEKGDVSIKVNGNGKLSPIYSYCDSDLNIRAYCNNPDTHYDLNDKGKLDVKRAVGEVGQIFVTQNLDGKNMFTSTAEIVSGEIAEDFTHYYMQSEQIPTSVSLGVFVDVDNSVKNAGGFIIQLLPFCSDEHIDILESKLLQLKPITTLLREGNSPEDIINNIFGDDYEILEKRNVNYKCNCSKDRFAKSLVTLGKNEISDLMLEENLETYCHFCNSKYYFTKDDLKEIYDSI